MMITKKRKEKPDIQSRKIAFVQDFLISTMRIL